MGLPDPNLPRRSSVPIEAYGEIKIAQDDFMTTIDVGKIAFDEESEPGIIALYDEERVALIKALGGRP